MYKDLLQLQRAQALVLTSSMVVEAGDESVGMIVEFVAVKPLRFSLVSKRRARLLKRVKSCSNTFI